MIISDKSQQPSIWEVRGRYALVSAFALLMVYVILRYFVPYWGGGKEGVIFCDAEYTRSDNFVSQGYVFKNGVTQSDEKVYKGNYASKTNRSQPNGMEYILRAPKTGDRYKVSVYRYRTSPTGGEIVVKGGKDSGFEKREDLASSKNKEGWELLELTFNVPANSGSAISIATFSNSNSAVYFDNLNIEKLSSSASALNVKPFAPKTFRLEIAEQFMQNILEKRQEALNSGILLHEDKDWVDAKINDGTQKLNADVRLKGNRLYHLQGNKWSYKVRVDDPYAWNRIKSLSLQSPASKSFLREWVFHELLRKEKLIATRYDFIQLRLNNRNRGIYAYEENPDIELATTHQRPIGPVVRFSEDAFWYNEKQKVDATTQIDADNQLINALDAAQIEPYKSNSIRLSDTLKRHFNVAQSLMHQYKYNLKPAKDIFDVDLMAKYFAIMDVMQAYQSLDWHDQRYYFNPNKSKLEPVGMSGFGVEIKPYRKRPYIGHELYNPNAKDHNIYMHLFLDKEFITQYCKYLYEFSTKSYIENFLLDIETEALRRQQFIRKEFSDYTYDAAAIIKNAKNIRSHLIPDGKVNIAAKISGVKGGRKVVKVANFHGLPIEIVGFGSTSTEMNDSLRNGPLLYTNIEGIPPKYVSITADNRAAYIFYKLPGVDKTFQTELSFWDAPEASVPAQYLFENAQLSSNKIYEIRGKLVAFKRGKHSINKDIIIPEGYQVNIPGGTELNFAKGTKFLSKSTMMTFGKGDQPVVIRGTNGFLLLDAPETSIFRNTYFVGASNLNYNNWWLPGGFTAYNSKVTFDHCTFSFSKAPESLSIMSSDFEIIGCNFNKNNQKGLVTHFSNGVIKKTNFKSNALIGVELLGSKVELDQVVIHQAASRGLSVGEESKVVVRSIEIKDTDIGVVSIDMSRLTIHNINLENCQRGFAAYQKKPEFGGSKIVVEDYQAKKVKVLHRIEPGSTLKIKGKEVRGY